MKSSLPLFVTIALLFCLSLVLSLAFGAVQIPLSTLTDVLWYKISGMRNGDWSNARELIIWHVRAPRSLLAMLTGGGLAIVGAVMQAAVRNSMADPYILGLSSGASAGASLAIFMGAMAGGTAFQIPLMAFLGSLLASAMVYFIAKENGRIFPGRLILAGISISYLFSAITSLLSILATEHKLREITHWLLGSVAGGNWEVLPIPAVVTTCGLIFLCLHGRELNVMVLGDETAVSLGVNPYSFRKTLFIVTSLVTGVLVAETGAIGFVGLMIPHFIRLFGINDYRKILPLSFFAGGIFLIWADVAARSLFSPMELPIGIITSICGAPCFIWILKRQRRRAA
ncbi:MAG: ABC transporter permease [Desulfobacterales bacterium]|nr:MAG: ABC transporter permease [Desulfobacterales bacterium]